MLQREAPVCMSEFVRARRAGQSDGAPCAPAGRSVIAHEDSTLLGVMDYAMTRCACSSGGMLLRFVRGLRAE
eukprot:6845867-Pyramimonas_sp.AAC.1